MPNVDRHKLQYGIGVMWSCRDEHGLTRSEYIEVESPLDQNRIGGTGPAPWADVPRYAWLVTLQHPGDLHIAGWIVDEDYLGAMAWRVVDIHIPWGNVIQLQVFRHDDWEDKPVPEEEPDNE